MFEVHSRFWLTGNKVILSHFMSCLPLIVIMPQWWPNIYFSWSDIYIYSQQHILSQIFKKISICWRVNKSAYYWYIPSAIYPACIDGLLQEKCNSGALAMELHLSCINPSIQSTLIYLTKIRYREYQDPRNSLFDGKCPTCWADIA